MSVQETQALGNPDNILSAVFTSPRNQLNAVVLGNDAMPNYPYEFLVTMVATQ